MQDNGNSGITICPSSRLETILKSKMFLVYNFSYSLILVFCCRCCCCFFTFRLTDHLRHFAIPKIEHSLRGLPARRQRGSSSIIKKKSKTQDAGNAVYQ